MRKIVFFLFCILLFLPGRTQNNDTCSFTISGQVLDEHDQQSLVNAEIEIKELNKHAWTDSLGNYSFKNICPGNYTLICKHPGCETITKKIRVYKNTIQNFEPEHHAELLKEIAINAVSVVTIEYIPPGIFNGHINGVEFEKRKNNSLAQMIKDLPGVVIQSTGPTIGKPVIHGMEGNRLLIYNNEVPLEAQQWGSEHAPEIDPLSAGTIEVIRGARSIRYGLGAIGGVVIVKPKEISRNYLLSGELYNGLNSNGRQLLTSAMLEGRLQKNNNWYARAQGSFNRGGNNKAPNYFISNTGIKSYNYSAIAGFDGPKTNFNASISSVQSELGIFLGAHVSNLTDLLNAFNAVEPLSDTSTFTYSIESPKQKIIHQTLKLKLNQVLKNNFSLDIIYARQFNNRLEFDSHSSGNDEAELDIMATSHYGAVKIKHVGKTNWEAGINSTIKRNTWEGRFIIPNYRSLQGGVFVLNEGSIFNYALRYSIGCRYDISQMVAWLWQDTVIVNPKYNFNGLSTHGSLNYFFNYYTQVGINIGSSWRPPAVNELFSNGLHHGAAAYETGNVGLEKENVLHADITAVKEHKRINGLISIYADRFLNYIYLQSAQTPVLTVQGAFPAFEYNQTDALITGIDFMGKYKITQSLSLQANASVLRGYNLFLSQPLPFMPANRFGYELKYAFKGSTKFKLAYVSASSLHVVKQNYVAPNSDYVAAPEGYMILGAQTGFQVKINKQWISINLEGSNLLNTKYRDYLNRFRYYTDEVGINVMLRINIPFGIIIRKEKNEI